MLIWLLVLSTENAAGTSKKSLQALLHFPSIAMICYVLLHLVLFVSHVHLRH